MSIGFYALFLLRDQYRRLSRAMSATLVGNNFSLIPLKILFHMGKKSVITAQIYIPF